MASTIRASKTFLPLSIAYLLVTSAGSAQASPGSALDPYAAIQPVAVDKNVKSKKKKEAGKKLGLALPHIGLGKKQAEPAEPVAKVEEDLSASQTYVTVAGSKGKSVKVATPKLQKENTIRVADTVEKTAEPAKTAAAPSEPGVMEGIKTIGDGYTKTLKAASHGVVSATKASTGLAIAGTKKVGSGIASGAKASGEVLAKGAGMVGQGFKATGEKLKEGTGSVGEKMAVIPSAIGHGLAATGEKMKDGTQATIGKLASLSHLGKGGGKSPMQQAVASSKQNKDSQVASTNAAPVPAPVKPAPAASIAASPAQPAVTPGKAGGLKEKLGFGKWLKRPIATKKSSDLPL